MSEVGHHGDLSILYESEECEDGRGVVCIKSVLVRMQKDNEVEEVAIYNDQSVSAWENGELVSSVRTGFLVIENPLIYHICTPHIYIEGIKEKQHDSLV